MTQIRTESGIQISYRNEEEDSIVRCTAALLDSMRAGLASFLVGFQVSRPLHVLGAKLDVSGIHDISLKRQLIFSSATKLQSFAAPTIADIAEAVGRETARYLASPVQPYHVLLPLNIDAVLLNGITSFSIGGKTLAREDWASAQDRYALADLVGKIDEYLGHHAADMYWSQAGVPLIFEVDARNPSEAIEQLGNVYEVLIGGFNFLNQASPVQLQNPEPLAKVRRPAAYGVFRADGTYAEAYVFIEQVNLQQNILPKDVVVPPVLELFDTLSRYGTKKGDTSTLFAEALATFGDGLQTARWQETYMSLWRAMELITFPNDGRYDTRHVVTRVKKLLASRDEVLSEFLDVCAANRNDFVHRGQFSPDGQSETLLFKPIVGQCLVALFKLIPSFPTRELLDGYHRS